MLSLHAADAVEPGGGRPPVTGGAVLVDGDRIAAVGPLEELAAAHPAARVRAWTGTVRAGRAEAAPQVLAAVPAGDSRERGEAVRRAVHGLLTRGVTAVTGEIADPVVRAAVARSGLRREAASGLAAGARADLAVFAPDGSCVATILAGRLVHRRA
ncbi:imidazolonepropionase-like domain-containing protein [Actinacidiphila acidipaludis]|uniref:Aminodeoxyfutalosine deaminase/Imidazolonepropionase-like composite domain-containing protein n=1 Tax=Actinacidiphila acidipaludis TaxID=2873382 RepID=A0ABS7Q4R5_9ACTN|nr:hypothetical protein [Streptomyces acidipaludis]MBY8878153.1 hypothetical protein [Streptomyces acidipaludis]